MNSINPVIVCTQNKKTKYAKIFLVTCFVIPTLYISFMSLVDAAGVSWQASAILPGLWIICITNLITLLGTPSLIVYDEGILLKFPFTRSFIYWNEIKLVRRGIYGTFIYVKRFGVLNYIVGIARLSFLSPGFNIGECRNAKAILDFIASKIV